jgi:hypothetical protein
MIARKVTDPTTRERGMEIFRQNCATHMTAIIGPIVTIRTGIYRLIVQRLYLAS